MAVTTDTMPLEETFYQGRQSISFKGVYQCTVGRRDGNEIHKLQLDIKRDSYNDQCRATIDIWDKGNLKWNRVYSIPPSELNVVADDVFCYRKISELTGEEKQAFNEDKNRLLAMAQTILK